MMTKTRWADGRYPCAGAADRNLPAHASRPAWSPAWLAPKLRARLVVEACLFLVAVAGVAYSAVLTKTAGRVPALAVLAQPEQGPIKAPSAGYQIETVSYTPASEEEVEPIDFAPVAQAQPETQPETQAQTEPQTPVAASNVRWFNGRPIRPAGTLRMRVTAYSPDARSCGASADGITATLHSVETNGFRLVAADPRVLRYGSLITVPGYAGDTVVPVLDCGGKIKGNRLDVLYASHEEARQWGSKLLAITVWEYADGKPVPNPRKLR